MNVELEFELESEIFYCIYIRLKVNLLNKMLVKQRSLTVIGNYMKAVQHSWKYSYR